MPLFSVSITLMNDSAYSLNAQVIDATGRHLALIHLVPGQMYIYDTMQGSFQKNTDQPYTPLTVIFLCQSSRPYDYNQKQKKKKKNEKPNKSQYINQFGMWTAVPRGALVNALGCPSGPKACVMKKHPKIKSKRSSSASTNQGTDNWSNDGGQTWSNDAGPGWFDCPEDGSPCQQRQSSSSGFSSKDSSKKWTNKEEINVQNAYGEDWDNDGGQSFSNDEDNSSKTSVKSAPSKVKETHSELGFYSKDGRNTQSKNTESSKKEEHISTKNTPLPFTETQ